MCLFIAYPSSIAQAQKLPPASRTVYKCTVNNKTVYSDEPCLGAQVIDVQPTRGMNKSTGRELTGSDVANEKRREQFADAVKPITGKSSQQMEVHRRRFNLSPEAKAECGKLDRGITRAEADEGVASGEAQADIQRNLFTMRKRSRDLGC